jgi:outer membrane protein assembly factor BamA
MNICRTLLTIVLLLPCWVSLTLAQQTTEGASARGVVESAEFSGIDENDLSDDIRKAVHDLVGKPFDFGRADDLIQQIQAENSALTVTTRLLPGSKVDGVKVIFAVEKSNPEAGGASNINSRYVVERVEVEGFDESRLNQPTRDDMQKLVGEKLDQEKANEILREIIRQVRPRYAARRKVRKGSDRQHVIVVYEVSKVPLIPFTDFAAQRFVYHSKQGFSIDFSPNLNDGARNRVFLGISDDQDQFIERFAGFSGGFQSTSVGTDRLGVALHYARYHERWQPSTVLADRNSIYRERNTFDPHVTFAFDPRIRVTAGVSVSELQIQYPAIHRANANAASASLIFHNIWGDGSDQHVLDAGYDVRAGNHTLDSDFIYTRHLLHAQYAYSHGKEKLFLSFLAGSISGNAPLFERFSLGDTTTLRGWNKFDIAPAGGNRVIHASVQYGTGKPAVGTFSISGRRRLFRLGFHMFYDVGAVGNSGSPMPVKHSAGFGFGAPNASDFFIELGFPIRSDHVQPIFSVGFRF